MSAAAIEASFEAVVEAIGDPVPQIYARLNAEHPDMEPLFVLDNDYAARGNMLAEFLDCLIDLAGERQYAVGYLQTMLINHEELGIPVDVFPKFFAIVHETFRSVLAEKWSPEFEAAWVGLAREFASVLESETV